MFRPGTRTPKIREVLPESKTVHINSLTGKGKLRDLILAGVQKIIGLRQLTAFHLKTGITKEWMQRFGLGYMNLDTGVAEYLYEHIYGMPLPLDLNQYTIQELTLKQRREFWDTDLYHKFALLKPILPIAREVLARYNDYLAKKDFASEVGLLSALAELDAHYERIMKQKLTNFSVDPTAHD